MRHPLIVFRYIEIDQVSQRDYVVEVIDKQPSVLLGAPPRLDQRIGKCDIYLCNNAFERAIFEQLVHVPVEVLHSGVHVHFRLRFMPTIRSLL